MYSWLWLYQHLIDMVTWEVITARRHGVMHPLDPGRDDAVADAIKEMALTIDRIRGYPVQR